MLHATRRLLTDTLHPLERAAAIELISLRGGPGDAEALLPRLLADPVGDGGLVEPIARHGDKAMVERLFDRFVADGRLVEGAPHDLLWAFGWAGLEQARPVLFAHACEANWDAAPAAVDGLVQLPPDGMEDQVRAAVQTCVGQWLFAEYLPALAGWIGDVELVDRFLVDDGGTDLPSTDCMAGVVLAVGLLGPVGRQRLHDLFWTDQYPSIWDESVCATGRAMRLTGLSVLDLATGLRARLQDPDQKPPHWWFVMVCDMARHQAASHGFPPVWRFLPPHEPALDLHHALFGRNDAWEEELGRLAMERLGVDGEWLSGDIHALRRPIEDLVRRGALQAELDACSRFTTAGA
ncbi:hypothetical protein [Brevundimonas sp.]|uniref:hypothetical protein n=1 Tax=Brevundimonas sp. TaxID=1871086 RepID=UPI002D2859BD|nr:hypothetical protein [Brevundimonas sp.]HYC97807.1 hypothetical protein [Brevundimonas sp.]